MKYVKFKINYIYIVDFYFIIWKRFFFFFDVKINFIEKFLNKEKV